MGVLLQIHNDRYQNLLFEVELCFVSKHFTDDSDKLVKAMPEGIIVCMSFCHLGIIVSFEVGTFFTTL